MTIKTFFGSLLYKVNGNMYGSSGQYAGTYLNKIAPYNETDFVAGYRTDSLAKLGFGKKAEFRLGVNNIFDNRAITEVAGDPTSTGAIVLGGPSVAGGDADLFVPGRALRLRPSESRFLIGWRSGLRRRARGPPSTLFWEARHWSGGATAPACLRVALSS